MSSFSETQDQMNAIAQSQATKLRVARRVIQPIIGAGYVDSVPGHRVIRGAILTVRPNQHLRPLQMSRDFSLHKEQSGDNSTVNTLIGFAAADIAQAEDAVVLLGSKAGPFLDKLQVRVENRDELDEQEGLLQDEAKKVGQPILVSILDGIKTLRERGQSGDYFVIVSADLYEEAYRDRKTPLDAPIYQINPLLAGQGFQFSEALPAKTGVIFSLARATISLSVPMDTYVDTSLSNDNQGRPRLAVSQQFRLVIDDPEARVDLK
jgi:uncharacterized linocin/CFP29 family protein